MPSMTGPTVFSRAAGAGPAVSGPATAGSGPATAGSGSGMTSPIENAPNTAYSPMVEVNQAASSTSVTVTSGSVWADKPGRARYRLASGRTATSSTTTNTTAPTRALLTSQT